MQQMADAKSTHIFNEFNENTTHPSLATQALFTSKRNEASDMYSYTRQPLLITFAVNMSMSMSR